MTLTPGTRLGVYEITAQIGEGGMGQVYRARDTQLDRDVAIKILPEAFAADAERVARFQREAKVLASLSHPNIAIIHGLEQADGVHALVMELVPGEDLSQRIARGAIPLDEALPIAKQIAEALEAAHEQGIIHRDLKPANVKVRPDGIVKVLDFGLAKALEPVSAGSTASATSPTITSPAMMTRVGMILGTAAYMSPEQARGRPADKRSDVWAFGCVLYEMLVGARAFAGDDVSDTLAAVLRGEPDWRVLPTETPASIRRLLRRCLEKDRKRRLADAADARLEIQEALTTPMFETSAAPAPGSQGGWRRGALIAAAALAVGGVAAGGAVWTAIRPAPARVTRTVIQTSGATALTTNPTAGGLAITPDGSRLVYTAASQLVVRRLDRFDSEALTGLGSPTQPFISPDGQSIGFFEGLILKKVAIGGGPAVTVFKDNNPNSGPLGATWGTDGTIVYAGSIGAGLKRVAADAAGGGEAETVTTPDRDRGEVRHSWPSFLPGGRALLFTISYAVRGPEIAVLNLETGAKTVLLSGLRARYLPSGHLVFGTENTLRAVAFDLERLTVAGEPVPVVSPVVAVQGPQGSYEYDVAADGTLVYLPTIITSPFLHTPVWVDRQGRETSLGMQARRYVHPRLSPDGTRIAVNEGGNISIWDLVRSRLTRGPLDRSSVLIWTPDSARLIFGSNRGGGGANLYVQAADGTGTATQLGDSPNMRNPTGITADGAQIVFNEATPTQLGDISLLTMTPTLQVKPLVATRADERGGVVSRDGRWLAYESDRSGAYEVWVQPFPTVDAGPWQVSTAGGVQPLWARDGRELFYVAPDGALMAVQWRGLPESAGLPTRLIEKRYSRGVGGTTVRQYDVRADGQRFLMMKEEARETDVAPSINVVQNWTEELKRLVPTK